MAFVLLEDLYSATRADVLRGKVKDFSAEERNDFEEILQKVRAGLPLQYAVGRTLFCGRYFMVSPEVLIPRPETEGIVSAVERFIPVAGGRATTRVLDCGTGSGCIATTIALDHPDWEVTGWDISRGALAVARKNAEVLGAGNAVFCECDLLADARRCHSLHESLTATEQYDVIVSNPPYICQREARDMEPHVLNHEPHTALFVPDADPLLFYRALAEIGRARLVTGGMIYVECNRAYTNETAALFKDYGFTGVAVEDDCFDVPRFVRGVAT